MIQTQFAHTVTIPDEWEHEGHTFQVFHDEYAECPTQWLDSADALCVIGGPHGCILHHPAETDCPAMHALDNFHEENGRLPTQEEWENLCPDYWVFIGWYAMDVDRLFAVAISKETWSANPCKSFVEEYSMWADGYVWVVSDTTTGDSVRGISADTEEDAIKYYTELCM